MILRAFFALAALAALGGALLTVVAKNPIRGAMALLLSIFGVAGLLLGLHAQFLAAVELIVYAGAVVVLFVFVVMLIGPQPSSRADRRTIVSRSIAGLAAGSAALAITAVLSRTYPILSKFPSARADLGAVEPFGRELFTRGLVPFEIMTVLFIVAVVGAVALVRNKPKPRGFGDGATKEKLQ
jgi:NADH-quinone oxidoreductase subunit J